MAEGGQGLSRSVLGGSDVDFEFTCTPCGEDNVRKEAIKYCPECQEYLCTSCTKHHGRLKILKSHKLVETSDVTRGHADVKATKCRYHGDRNIEMYCGEHDMVYCAKCIATAHRSCSGVVGIEDIKSSHALHDEIQRLQSEVRDVQGNKLSAADKTKRYNLKHLEEEKNSALETVENMEQELIARIRKLSAQTADAVKKHYLDVKVELESDVEEIENITVEVKRSMKQLEMFVHMDSTQQFVHMKLIKNSVSNGKKMIEEKTNETKHLSFIRDIGFDKLVKNLTSLGKVEINVTGEKASRSYKVKSKKLINVKQSKDRTECDITGICQLPDGTVLLADNSNRKVKRLDGNYNVRDHCDLDAGPWDICCTDQNVVAVRMSNRKVQFISVNTSMTKSRQITVGGARYFGGIAYWDDSLWMSTDREVYVYSMSGVLLKSIVQDADGHDIFKSYTYGMRATRDVMIVTDSSDVAVCLNRDGVVQQEIRNGKLNYCTGVTVSGDGTVFLSGFFSHNIMMFSLDGTCLGELVTKDDGLRNALSVHIDNKKNCLIVSVNSSDKLHIFMLD